MAALGLCTAGPARGSISPVHAQHAIVVSVHELASRAGVEAMQAGGNAVDAAVATGFALAVVHPPAGNLGGGGFMLIRMADGKTHFLDYREKAPAAATRNMYLDPQGNVVGEGDIVAQTRQVMENLRLALGAAGATFDDVVKVTNYVTDASQWPKVLPVRAAELCG